MDNVVLRSWARTGRASGGRLDRGVGVLQPEHGVVGVVEVVVGLALQGGDLVRDVGQVAGDVLCSVGVVPRPGVRMFALAYLLRIAMPTNRLSILDCYRYASLA
jgi:hypothetical protein